MQKLRSSPPPRRAGAFPAMPHSIRSRRLRGKGPGPRSPSSRSPMAQNPNSAAARDVAYVVHPYTNLRAHESKGPLVITGGERIYVTDDDGQRYIEGLSGLWCTGLGFSEKR